MKKLSRIRKKNAKSDGKMEKAKNVDYSPSGNSQKVSDKGLFCLGDSVMLSKHIQIYNLFIQMQLSISLFRDKCHKHQMFCVGTSQKGRA